MRIIISENAGELGKSAAQHTAEVLRSAISKKGKARMVLSTGQSQFETLESLLEQDIDWNRVEVFHLDEYIGLPESHPASFRKYLNERFVSKIKLSAFYPVNGEGDVMDRIEELNRLISSEPVDIGLIGIGENAHIAFNDPPADFEEKSPYIIVKLDSRCREQQVREGWFPDTGSVPEKAVSMSVQQILKCGCIISSVPHQVKARAVKLTLESEITPDVPASILKTHGSYHLYLDTGSASEIMRGIKI